MSRRLSVLLLLVLCLGVACGDGDGGVDPSSTIEDGADPSAAEGFDVWEANVHLQADQQLPSGDTCQQTGDARGDLHVAADGRISGTLEAEEIETCSFGFDRTRSGLSLVLAGTASASALTVHHTGNTSESTTTGYFLLGFFSAPGVLDPVPVPITAPGVAEGSVTREMPNNYTITLTFDFRCETCEAVGG